MTPDEQALRAFFPAWQQASLANDTAALSEMLADDVIFLTAEMPPIQGKQAFLALLSSAPAPYRIRFDDEFKELNLFGDFAQTWTHLTVTVVPVEGAPTIQRAGDILTLFHKQPNGKWVILRDANMLKIVQPEPPSATT